VIWDNQAAVENQRSFSIEDMDGDGRMDLIQTSGSYLFGAVLLGSESGNFYYKMNGYFLTGYEPTIAIPGPMGEGGRELVSINLRTGSYTIFKPQGLYLPARKGGLDIIPEYATHLIELGSGADYLLASRAGAPHLYQWSTDSVLTEASEALPGEPTLTVTGDVRLDGGLGSLQVHQIGSYASVILTNSMQQTFNVANLRIAPGIFLVIGDLERRGTLDVGVAVLLTQNRSN